jgi:hypothetical protein
MRNDRGQRLLSYDTESLGVQLARSFTPLDVFTTAVDDHPAAPWWTAVHR